MVIATALTHEKQLGAVSRNNCSLEPSSRLHLLWLMAAGCFSGLAKEE